MTQPTTTPVAGAEQPSYRSISTRLADFRRDYPFHCMYELVRTQRLSELQLRNADGQPLPCVEFTCGLKHFDRVFATATTLIPIEGNKSWECGETNALSRLLELLGYGRDLTDADEAEQRRIMEDLKKGKPLQAKAQLAVVPAATQQSTQSVAETAAGIATAAAANSATAGAKPATNDAKFASREPAAKPNAAKASTSVAVDALGIRLSIRDAVIQRARLQNKAVPDFKTVEEFEAFRLEVFGSGKAAATGGAAT